MNPKKRVPKKVEKGNPPRRNPPEPFPNPFGTLFAYSREP
jgi:hypothetical protein